MPERHDVFHEECVGDTTTRTEGREFDTIENQLAKNGDRSKRIVLKIDVEGAEWESFLSTPAEVLEPDRSDVSGVPLAAGRELAMDPD